MRPKQYRRHSAEFKIRLVQEFLEGAGSLRSISQEHGISNTLLQVWVDKFQQGLLTGDRVDEEKHRDQEKMNKPDRFEVSRNEFVRFLLIVVTALFLTPSYASEDLQSGDQYQIVRPVYLMATYSSYSSRYDKRPSRETARAYLHSERYADTSWVAFQREVPVGTIMTIIGPVPKVWHLPFFTDWYFVRLDPDLSRGLDVVLELNRGLEGSLNGLNPEIFELIHRSDDQHPESK